MNKFKVGDIAYIIFPDTYSGQSHWEKKPFKIDTILTIERLNGMTSVYYFDDVSKIDATFSNGRRDNMLYTIEEAQRICNTNNAMYSKNI